MGYNFVPGYGSAYLLQEYTGLDLIPRRISNSFALDAVAGEPPEMDSTC